MIYLKLQGRTGNQLFMYATARMIQNLKGDNDEIIIDDAWGVGPEGQKYENDLVNYKLNNVSYIHDTSLWNSKKCRMMRIKWAFINRLVEHNKDNNKRYKKAIKCQWLYNALGIFHIEDGYVPYPKKFKKDVYVHGFFQSEKFFEPIKEEIINTFKCPNNFEDIGYPNFDQIKDRNTVCISIKVQHNAGNYMYDVCHEDYYEKAIAYITERVENPLFFVCSDNVEYVKEHLIDTNKYDVICQDTSKPAYVSLSVMSYCKHFIIGNTSFGWWAQYLATNPDKIVIVPDRWYNGMDDWQYDIYEENWVRIEA